MALTALSLLLFSFGNSVGALVGVFDFRPKQNDYLTGDSQSVENPEVETERQERYVQRYKHGPH